mgnify:CR=1 FL=1
MLKIGEINEAIRDLEENCPTTYSNCLKLASLYIVKDYYMKSDNAMYDDEMNMPIGQQGQGNNPLDIMK